MKHFYVLKKSNRWYWNEESDQYLCKDTSYSFFLRDARVFSDEDVSYMALPKLEEEYSYEWVELPDITK